MSSEDHAIAPAPASAAIAPWLSVTDAAAAVSFYGAAFGAAVRYRLDDDTGKPVIAQLAIHDADFWVQTDATARSGSGDGGPVRMILTVPDPDLVFAQALAAGATEVVAVNNAHGWRIGRFVDPFGHHWEIGKRLDEPSS